MRTERPDLGSAAEMLVDLMAERFATAVAERVAVAVGEALKEAAADGDATHAAPPSPDLYKSHTKFGCTITHYAEEDKARTASEYRRTGESLS